MFHTVLRLLSSAKVVKSENGARPVSRLRVMLQICNNVLSEAAKTKPVQKALLTGSVEAGFWLSGDVQRCISFDRPVANTEKPLTKQLKKQPSNTMATTSTNHGLAQPLVIKGLDNHNGTPACF